MDVANDGAFGGAEDGVVGPEQDVLVGGDGLILQFFGADEAVFDVPVVAHGAAHEDGGAFVVGDHLQDVADAVQVLYVFEIGEHWCEFDGLIGGVGDDSQCLTIGFAECWFFGEGVLGADIDVVGVAKQRLGLEMHGAIVAFLLFFFVVGDGGDADVEAAAQEFVWKGAHGDIMKHDFDFWVGGGDAFDDVLEHEVAEHGNSGEMDDAGDFFTLGGEGLPGGDLFFQVRKDAFAVVVHTQAVFGGIGAAFGAVQEHDVELVFKRLNGFGERGLGEIKFAGGLVERMAFNDFDEIAQLFQFHNGGSSFCNASLMITQPG